MSNNKDIEEAEDVADALMKLERLGAHGSNHKGVSMKKIAIRQSQ